MQLISFNSTFDIYTTNFAADTSGAAKQTPALVQSGVACRFQPDESQANTDYRKLQEQRKANVFFEDSTAYGNISIESILKISGVDYKVTGKQNAGNLSKLFKVTVLENISGNPRLP